MIVMDARQNNVTREADGIECKTCGCRVCEKMDSPPVQSTAGAAYMYRCLFCKSAFYANADSAESTVKPIAVFLRTPCPACGSVNTQQTGGGPRVNTDGVKVRSHKCAMCKLNFTSRDVLK